MKRTDLTVGQHYLASTYNDWRRGNQPTHEVVVVDTGRWNEQMQYSTGRPQQRTLQLADGTTRTTTRDIVNEHREWGTNGVLVEYATNSSYFHSKGEVEVMNPAHIRGVYAEAQAEADGNYEAYVAKRDEEAKRYAADRQALEHVVDQLATVYGIKATLGAYPYSRDVVLDRGNAEHLLALLLDTGASLVEERDQLQAQVRQLEERCEQLQALTCRQEVRARTAEYGQD